MMSQFGGLVFGAQVGQALGQLAGEVLSSTDIGVPLADAAALLPANVAAFGDGLEVPAPEVRLYAALREAAHRRLFGHVPWLRGHLVAAVEAYAAGIAIDTGAIEQAMMSVDPSNPESVQDALGGGLFSVEKTPEQAALARLETALALVEGWVDDVAGAAAAEHLPNAAALGETMRRRRATGGPAEQTFATLVGLELRPRRLREAATVWRWLRERRGVEGRDAVWGHPDLLPTTEDLADPVEYVRGAEDQPEA
jgi:putative hydrolase